MALLSSLVIPLILAILGATFVSIRRFFIRSQFARRHGCQPVARSCSKDPFLGLDTVVGSIRAFRNHRLLELECELFRDFGNTFTLKELQRRAIVTIEPENIKTILSLSFQDYGIRHRLKPFKPLLGVGIFNTDGEHWASSRALIRPSFNREQVANLTTLEELFQDLFLLLPQDGTTVDLQELFFRYTIDSATEFLFGQSANALKQGQGETGFAEAFHYAQMAIVMRSILAPLDIFYRDRKADESNRICRDFAQQFVEEAVAEAKEKEKGVGTKQKRIFSHELASRTSDKQRILDELMNLLLAGRDTTASLLGNLFFMLAKDAAIWEKLRSEVAVLQGRPPTYEELQELKYVQCCINECTRLFTSILFGPTNWNPPPPSPPPPPCRPT
jgi:cytochrome P450